ncbi:MAG: hypothetical protein ACLVJ6_10080 [Merdibacter sp.]
MFFTIASGELSEAGNEIWTLIAADFTALSAHSFMIFNLCAPCFAAMGAIKREMNNPKWTLGAIGYMCGFAYVMRRRLPGRRSDHGEMTAYDLHVIAMVLLAALVYLLIRP